MPHLADLNTFEYAPLDQADGHETKIEYDLLNLVRYDGLTYFE